MPQENKRVEAYIYVRTFLHTYPDRHVLRCMLHCAAMIALLCFAKLAVQQQYTYSYILLLHCYALEQLLVQRFRPLRSLTKRHGLELQTDVKVDGTTF